MRNTLLATILGPIAVLALVACNGNQQPANEPRSETSTTSVTIEPGPVWPGEPAGISPASGGPTSTSGAPASPMAGGCPQAVIYRGAFDRADCIQHCRGMDETVPLGSKCVSQYESCTAQCNRLFRLR